MDSGVACADQRGGRFCGGSCRLAQSRARRRVARIDYIVSVLLRASRVAAVGKPWLGPRRRGLCAFVGGHPSGAALVACPRPVRPCPRPQCACRRFSCSTGTRDLACVARAQPRLAALRLDLFLDRWGRPPGFRSRHSAWCRLRAHGRHSLRQLRAELLRLGRRRQSWTQVYADHPDINALASLEQKYGEIYRLSWASIVEAPEKLLLGIVRAYGRYIVGTGWHKFFDDSVVRGVAILLTLAGLVECIRRRREEDAAFLLVVTVGVFASVPFLMDGGPRVFAATIPVTAALIGIGAVALARWAGRPIDQIDDTRISPAPAVAIVAFLFVLAGPAVPPAAGSLKRPQPEAHACRDGWVPAVFDHRPGAYLLVWPGDIGTQRLPNVRSADFLEEFPLPDLVTPAYFSRRRERLSDRWGWFVVNGSTEASPSLRLCGQWNEAGVFVGKRASPTLISEPGPNE